MKGSSPFHAPITTNTRNPTMNSFLDSFERWFFGTIFFFLGVFFLFFLLAIGALTWQVATGQDFTENSYNRARIEKCKNDGGTYTTDSTGWFTGCIVGPAAVVINRNG